MVKQRITLIGPDRNLLRCHELAWRKNVKTIASKPLKNVTSFMNNLQLQLLILSMIFSLFFFTRLQKFFNEVKPLFLKWRTCWPVHGVQLIRVLLRLLFTSTKWWPGSTLKKKIQTICLVSKKNEICSLEINITIVCL